MELRSEHVSPANRPDVAFVPVRRRRDRPTRFFQYIWNVRRKVRMHVVVFALRVQAVETFSGQIGVRVGLILVVSRIRIVPADARDGFSRAIWVLRRELLQRLRNDPQTRYIWRLLAARKQRLQSHADPEERLACLDVRVDGRQVPRGREAGQAVPEVADAGEDDFL